VPRRPVIAALTLAGLVLSIAAFVPLALAPTGLSPAAALGLIALVGLGLGPTFPFTIVVVQNAVAMHQLGVTTGTMNFFRALGSTFIVAGFGAIVLAGAPAIRGVAAGAVLTGTDAAESFRWVFAAAMLCLTIALVCSAFWIWRRQQQARALLAARSGATGSIVQRVADFAIPQGLDGEQVLAAARGRFIRLQAAWDAADISALRSLTTPEMLEELLHVLTARESRTSRTDVISLHAELLGLEELGAAYLASIEFSGLIRESAEAGEVPFRELWMLAGTKGDEVPSWRLARQQALL